MPQSSGQGDGGEIPTPIKNTAPDMRQAGGQGDGGEIHTIVESPVSDMRQGSGQGNLFLVRQECNQPLALYIYQTAVLE